MWKKPNAREILAGVVAFITMWGALAEVAPGTFQVTNVPLLGARLLWVGVPLAIVWIFWTLNSIQNRLHALATGEQQPDTSDEFRLRTFAMFDDDTNIISLSVTNDGPRDSFIAQVRFVLGTINHLVYPFTAKWDTTTEPRYDLVSGHTQHVHLCKVVLSDDRIQIAELRFIGPTSTYALRPHLSRNINNNVLIYNFIEIHVEIRSTDGHMKSASVGMTMYITGQNDLTVNVLNLAD